MQFGPRQLNLLWMNIAQFKVLGDYVSLINLKSDEMLHNEIKVFGRQGRNKQGSIPLKFQA